MRKDFGTRPFLRWVGGKQRLARRLAALIPRVEDGQRYFEPFLGAGAVFLALQPARAVLSDSNQLLMEMYEAVRDHPAEIASGVFEHACQDSARYYKLARGRYNRSQEASERAALFIYLNRTCFNGVFRVNRKGEFNVPYGWKQRVTVPSEDSLRRVSGLLHRAVLRSQSFEHILDDANSGDVVYLDPPYPPLNGTSFFTHYTQERFSPALQTLTAEVAQELRARGCHVVITNANTPFVKKLYKSWHTVELSVPRYVTASGAKHHVSELVITSSSRSAPQGEPFGG